MATIVARKNPTTGTTTRHLRVHLPSELGAKNINVGISKLPEPYHPTLKARTEAFVIYLRKQVRLGKSPKGVDYTGTLQTYIHNQMSDMLMEHLGMTDMSITLNDEVVYVPQTVVAVPVTSTSKQISVATNSPTIGDVVAAYMAYKAQGGVSNQTLASTRSRLESIMLQCIDRDTLVSDIDFNFLNGKLFDADNPMSLLTKALNTQKATLTTIKSLFKWTMTAYGANLPVDYKDPTGLLKPAAASESVDKGTGKVVRLVKKASEQRDTFTDDEIKKLMKKASQVETSMDWFVYVSMLTGARLNELAQLHRDNVKWDEESGLVSIEIARVYQDQTLKTPNSERTIPLGFPDKETARAFYKFSQEGNPKAPNNTFFGFSYNPTMNNYASATKHNVKYLKGIFGDDFNKGHHSFRHTIINYMKKGDLNESVIKQFVGHSQESDITAGRYGKPYTPEELYSRLKDAGVYNNYY